MKRRDAERLRATSLVDAVRGVADALRSGASLRQALVSCAGGGSPLDPVATALATGAPLAPILQAAAADADTDTGAVLCVLAVHAEAGGDPLPACEKLADRLVDRISARDEARALTTQARAGARAILLLTPAFLVLVVASDPKGAVAMLGDPRSRLAIVTGLVLQGVGAFWIGSIVRSVGSAPTRASQIPVLRAVRALLAGRARSRDAADVAETCDVVVLALDAGVSTSAAIGAAAPFARGTFGEALRAAVSSGESIGDAVDGSLGAAASRAGARFATAVRTSTDLGVPLAPALRALADDVRRAEAISVAEDIRRATVRVLVPLGTLVLPAFVLACLVPLFVGGLANLAR